MLSPMRCSSWGFSTLGNTFEEQCNAYCSSSNSSSIVNDIRGPNATDPMIYNVSSCNCNDSNHTTCQDWVPIFDTKAPLATCHDKQITTKGACSSFCSMIGQGIRNFSMADQLVTCSCSRSTICSDATTCQQLKLFPPKYASGCVRLCNASLFDTSVYWTIVLDHTTRAMLQYECTCPTPGRTTMLGGTIRSIESPYIPGCRDKVLLSDAVEHPPGCSALNITEPRHCQLYCDRFGLFYADMTMNGVTEGCICFAEDGPQVTVCNTAATAGTPSSGVSSLLHKDHYYSVIRLILLMAIIPSWWMIL